MRPRLHERLIDYATCIPIGIMMTFGVLMMLVGRWLYDNLPWPAP